MVKMQNIYQTVKTVRVVVGIPEIFDRNKHEHAINTALPFELNATLKGMVNLVILLSSSNLTSQLVNISGMATGLQKKQNNLISY
jgi:hypothetical protein